MPGEFYIFSHESRRRSHSFAGQFAGLLHPSGELSFVELVVLVDVEVAHFDGRQQTVCHFSGKGRFTGAWTDPEGMGNAVGGF